MSISILGHLISAPILIAPTAFHKLVHPEGEIATAKAVVACKTIMVLSFSSMSSLEEIASSCDAVRFFQLYVFKNREGVAWLVKRAEISSYKAIVVTVDRPRLGRREAHIKNKMIAPQLKNLEVMSTKVVTDKGLGAEAFANSMLESSFCWKDINWLRSMTRLPILVKGILSHEKMIVRAVGGKVPVLLDGGIRRGTDIFKALALGAQAVLVQQQSSRNDLSNESGHTRLSTSTSRVN